MLESGRGLRAELRNHPRRATLEGSIHFVAHHCVGATRAVRRSFVPLPVAAVLRARLANGSLTLAAGDGKRHA
ncbi:MAG TPA: hypothetical protein VF989_00560 [Polyangiaceae bacterium]